MSWKILKSLEGSINLILDTVSAVCIQNKTLCGELLYIVRDLALNTLQQSYIFRDYLSRLSVFSFSVAERESIVTFEVVLYLEFCVFFCHNFFAVSNCYRLVSMK